MLDRKPVFAYGSKVLHTAERCGNPEKCEYVGRTGIVYEELENEFILVDFNEGWMEQMPAAAFEPVK